MFFGGAMVVMAVIAMIAFAVNITKIIDDETQLIDLYKIVGGVEAGYNANLCCLYCEGGILYDYCIGGD